jgi:hypothetical protein
VLLLYDFVWQLVNRFAGAGEMFGEHLGCFVNSVNDAAAEIFLLKMRAHRVYQRLPERVATFLVHTDIAHHREPMRARRYENEHGIAVVGLVHAKLHKFLHRAPKRIIIKLTTLDKNTDLAGSSSLRFLDCLHDSLVIEALEKTVCAHFFTSSSQRRRRQNFRRLN